MDSYFVVAAYEGNVFVKEVLPNSRIVSESVTIDWFETREEAEKFASEIADQVWEEYHRPPCYFCGELTEIHQQGDVCFRCLQEMEDSEDE